MWKDSSYWKVRHVFTIDKNKEEGQQQQKQEEQEKQEESTWIYYWSEFKITHGNTLDVKFYYRDKSCTRIRA